MANRTIKHGDKAFRWDDEHLVFLHNCIEEWRVAWTALSKVVLTGDKSKAYVFTCADGNEYCATVGSFRLSKLETLLRSMDIEVTFGKTDRPLGSRRWTLKNHFVVGSLPDLDGKGHQFVYQYDLALESVKLWFSIYCLCMAAMFAGILYLILDMAYQAIRHGRPVFYTASDGSFFAVLALLALAGLPFVVKSPLLHYRSRQIRKLSLLFIGDKLYVLEGDRRQEAFLVTKKIGLFSDYCLVELNGKKLVFDLLMTEQR